MMNRFAKYLPSPLVLLAFLGSYAAFFIMGSPVFSDPDSLWHIAAGDLIRATGAIPDKDSWSYTSGDQPWYLISWLFDIVLSFVHQLGGLKAVYIFPQLLLALLIALIVHGLLQRGQVGSDVIILTGIGATLSLAMFATARPQLIAFLLAAVMQQILHKSRSENRYGRLLWLPVLMCVWVNVHGSFVVGISLLGAYGLEAIIMRQWVWLKRLFLIGIACVLALLLNPYGFGMYAAMNRTLDSAITQYIQEWLPFVFSSNLGLSLWFLLFIIASNFRENSAPIADRIIAAIWFVFMLFSIRNAGSFIILAAPYIAINLQRFVEYLESVVTKRPDIMETLGKPGMGVRLLIASLLVVAGSYAAMDHIKDNYRVSPQGDFSAAIDYVVQHHGDVRFLNDYAMGGQMIYRARDALPLFIDGRSGTVYSEPVLNSYIDFLFLNKNWTDIVRDYNIGGIIVANSHRFAAAYESGQYHDHWTRVFHDEAASVYIKR